jgi:hypothetical protein
MRRQRLDVMPNAFRLPTPALVAIAVLAWGMTALPHAQNTPPAPPSAPGPSAPAAAPAAARRPAATLLRPATPTKAPDAAGFIQRWLVLEPIRTNGQLTDSAVRTLVTTEHFPNQLTALPRAGDKVTVGTETLSWHAVDTTNYNVNLYHFAYALSRPTSNVLFWAATVVHAPRDVTGVRLAIGSNAASVWWVNGEEVISIFNDRQATIDDGVSNRLTLKRGANIIRGAIVNGGGATDFCARFLDEDGHPVKGFTISLTAGAN